MLGKLMYAALWYSLWLFRKLRWRWTIEGLENLPSHPQGGVVVVNHINWTDIHILGASLPLARQLWWIAKVEMFENRVAAWWLRQMRVIPIKRGKRDLSALYAGEEMLKRGELLAVFPEGTRSRVGGLQEGKSGAIRLATRTNTPIIPIAIWGTEHGFKGAMQRKPIYVKIGKPYYPHTSGTSIQASEMDVLVDEMMIRLAALLPEQYRGVYREKSLMVRGQGSGVRGQETTLPLTPDP